MTPITEKQMMHGLDWDGVIDLAGWIITEKFDGCRAYWDGANLWTRGGKLVAIPQQWRDSLPGIALDCELYDGIDGRSRCASALRTGKFTSTMQLVIFDAPNAAGYWQHRIASVPAITAPFIRIAQASICQSHGHLMETLAAVKSAGGEGLMLRHPQLTYAPGRTFKMLKVKEAI
jgi:DNA ligase-1